jgi:hypothetical protein
VADPRLTFYCLLARNQLLVQPIIPLAIRINPARIPDIPGVVEALACCMKANSSYTITPLKEEVPTFELLKGELRQQRDFTITI